MISALMSTIEYAGDFTDKGKQLTIAALVFTIPLLVSFLVLFDAFRRFRKTKNSEQVIKNTNVFALSFVFLLYAVGSTIMLVIHLIYDKNLG